MQMRLPSLTNKLSLAVTAACVVFLSACGTPPKRAPYEGPDQVGAINASDFVGQWDGRILNPIADENDNTLVYEFISDGTFKTTMIPGGQQQAALGDMRFEGAGTWQAQGEQLFTKTNSVAEVTGNSYGKIMQSIVNSFVSKQSGSVNPYEVSTNQIIFVHEDTGSATLLRRR